MTKEHSNIFKSFESVKVLIIGDVMIDRYLEGVVSRISPEAPVPIVHLHQRENRLGGAANVALNVKALGATPYLCSIVGQDDNAKILMDLLPKRGLWQQGVALSPNRVTTTKTRVIASNQHLLRVDSEDLHELNQEEESILLEKVEALLKKEKIDVILFQDYNKGVLSKNIIHNILRQAKEKNIPTLVDPKKENFLAYKGVTVFKPNLKEIQEALPFDVKDDLTSLQIASRYLQEKLNNQYTLITLSDKGLFIDDYQNPKIIPTTPRQIADVCGAGDTVISVLAVAMGAKMDMASTAILANLAGGQVCEKVGVVPVDRLQLEQEFFQ